MAIRFKRVQRLCDPTNKEAGKKVYPVISYQYDTSATLDEFAKEISSTSGVSEGETISVLKDFRTLLRKTLLSGRSVNIKGLGYFFLSAQSKGTEKAEDFTVSDISGLRVCFRANSDIRLFTGTSRIWIISTTQVSSTVIQAKEAKHRILTEVQEVMVKHPIRQLDKRKVGN